jgi:hypothetical protein
MVAMWEAFSVQELHPQDIVVLRPEVTRNLTFRTVSRVTQGAYITDVKEKADIFVKKMLSKAASHQQQMDHAQLQQALRASVDAFIGEEGQGNPDGMWFRTSLSQQDGSGSLLGMFVVKPDRCQPGVFSIGWCMSTAAVALMNASDSQEATTRLLAELPPVLQHPQATVPASGTSSGRCESMSPRLRQQDPASWEPLCENGQPQVPMASSGPLLGIDSQPQLPLGMSPGEQASTLPEQSIPQVATPVLEQLPLGMSPGEQASILSEQSIPQVATPVLEQSMPQASQLAACPPTKQRIVVTTTRVYE